MLENVFSLLLLGLTIWLILVFQCGNNFLRTRAPLSSDIHRVVENSDAIRISLPQEDLDTAPALLSLVGGISGGQAGWLSSFPVTCPGILSL